MDSSFSKALDLNGMSTTTTIVVWAMIIFLIVLVGSIAIFFLNQSNKQKKDKVQFPFKEKNGKGF